MIYCTQCGKELKDDAVFCTSCGVRLEPSAVPAEPVMQEPEQEPEPVQETVQAQDYDPIKSEEEKPDAAVIGQAQHFYVEKEKVIAPTILTPPVRVYTFLNTGVGLIYALLLIFAVCIMTRFAAHFFDVVNIYNVMIQMIIYAVLGIALVLSLRAKGPDLSIGFVLGLSSTIIAQTMNVGGSLTMGILLALSAGLIIGLINGLAATYLKVPAVIVTLVTGIIVNGVNMALLQGQTIPVVFPDILRIKMESAPIGLLVILGVAFLFAFIYILFSKLGTPLHKRDKKAPAISYMFAYIASALIAVLAGFAVLSRIQAAMMNMGTGYEAYLLFVFALLMGSRGLDNRFAPALYAVVPAFIWSVLTNVMVLWNVIVFYQPIVYGGLALISLCVGYVCRIERKAKTFNIPPYESHGPAKSDAVF